MSTDDTADFTASLGCLIEPALAGLAVRLRAVGGVTQAESDVLTEAVGESLRDTLHRKLARVLALELDAARVTGRLTAATSAARWDEFIELTTHLGYWQGLAEQYPSMLGRVSVIVANRCAAAVALAQRLAADRDALTPLLGRPFGELVAVAFGRGDSHRGGQAVAILRGNGGSIVYKPRSVRVDAVLDEFLGELLDGVTGLLGRIRVPRVLDRDAYGWAAFAQHAYCGREADLAHFYRGVGHWLAVMRLLGGSDLHAENVIAVGSVPMVIDCETLFTPQVPAPPTGLGLAVDRAGELVDGTVLRTGLLPGRGLALRWRGVDACAVGGLPGRQPLGELPVLVGAGTDLAHIVMAPAQPQPSQNHPSPDPALGRHWDRVLNGFIEVTDLLSRLDKADRLAPMLSRFAGRPIRVVLRSTEAYAEIERMLWHPVSLHDPDPAIERAERILADMAQSVPGAPSDPAVIRAEVADPLDGDAPFFATTPASGRLAGPRDTRWLDEQDLVADALIRWRGADLVLERQVIQSALVSAYLNEGWLPTEQTPLPATVDTTGLTGRRRRVLAGMMRRLGSEAIHGADGSVTWIAPVLNPTGWAVQPLSPDFYGGAPGVAIVLAAYRREAAAGRADPVAGVDDLLADVVRTMCLAEKKAAADLSSHLDVRPPPLGAQIGLGGQIWSWLALDGLGAAREIAIDRAVALTTQIPGAVEADDEHSLRLGAAGAIVPLLALADRTGDEQFQDMAVMLGDRLIEVAKEVALPTGGVGAIWPTLRWPAGLGGLAHGSTGIGWALARLALRTGRPRFASLARQAFAFEDLLWDPVARAWRDLREPDRCSAAWCHGAVGIGLLADDLHRRGFDGGPGLAAVGAAAARTLNTALGWNHTLCHGDLGAWELLDAVAGTPLAPPGLDRTTLDAQLIGSIEQHGPVSGMARDAFTPGLLPGVGGVAYQLLRFDRTAGLPSVLVLGGGLR